MKANDTLKEFQIESSLAMIEKPPEYAHLNDSEKKQLAMLDLKVSLLKDRIKQAQLKQIRKFERGPLAQIRNKEKLQEFLTQVIQHQSKKQMIAKKLSKLEAFHFEMSEDPQFGQSARYDDSSLLFDTVMMS